MRWLWALGPVKAMKSLPFQAPTRFEILALCRKVSEEYDLFNQGSAVKYFEVLHVFFSGKV